MNKYRFFTLSLVISLLSCLLFGMSIFELFSDAEYVKSMNLQSNADSLMIPAMGGFTISLIVALFFVMLHLLFLLRIRKLKQQSTIDLGLWVGKKYTLLKNIILIISYLIALFWIKSFIGITEHKFYLINTIFYISALLTTIIYAIWLINLLPSFQFFNSKCKCYDCGK